MAKMIPRDLPPDAPTSERRVHEALTGLDDGWTVLWSVGWQDLRHGRQGDGEADFVLLNPDHGLIIAEVKGGGISILKAYRYP